MTYDANYTGQLTVEPPLNETEQKALELYFDARHCQTVNGPLDIRKSLSPGHPDVVDWNKPALGDVPGLHCNLRVANGGSVLEWDGEEKPGDLTDWVRYVINAFLRPVGYFSEPAKLVEEGNLLHGFTFNHTVNGVLKGSTSRGEAWEITVKDNEVSKVETAGLE